MSLTGTGKKEIPSTKTKVGKKMNATEKQFKQLDSMSYNEF